MYRKVQEELVRVGRELKEEKENGEKETRTRKQLETALKVEQTNTLIFNVSLHRLVMIRVHVIYIQ